METAMPASDFKQSLAVSYGFPIEIINLYSVDKAAYDSFMIRNQGKVIEHDSGKFNVVEVSDQVTTEVVNGVSIETITPKKTIIETLEALPV